jgi:hypothetical protein
LILLTKSFMFVHCIMYIYHQYTLQYMYIRITLHSQLFSRPCQIKKPIFRTSAAFYNWYAKILQSNKIFLSLILLPNLTYLYNVHAYLSSIHLHICITLPSRLFSRSYQIKKPIFRKCAAFYNWYVLRCAQTITL